MAITIIILAFGFGLVTSLHCVGMCGPIALSIGLSAENKLRFAIKNLTYQLGRVSTYVILGIILGLLGSGVTFAGFQNSLSICIGVLMILTVFIPKFYDNNALQMGFLAQQMLHVKMQLAKLLRKQDYSSLYLTGILNGLLPCGSVYAALTAALGFGSIRNSLLFMLFFGLGTIPLMFFTMLLGNFISVENRQRILKILPVIIVVLGVIFILRGLDLNIPYISPALEALQINGEDHSH